MSPLRGWGIRRLNLKLQHRQPVDFRLRAIFRNGHQQAVGQFRIPSSQRNAGKDALVQRGVEQLIDAAACHADDKFLEGGP